MTISFTIPLYMALAFGFAGWSFDAAVRFAIARQKGERIAWLTMCLALQFAALYCAYTEGTQ